MNRILFSLLFIIPLCTFGQLSESLKKMQSDTNPQFENYESLHFEATTYIFSHPINLKSKEFLAALGVIDFWKNIDTGRGIPTFGKFYKALTNKNQQQYLYMIAMIHYGLNQKINHDRLLKCKKIEGQIYSEQEDVKEVQLGGAKILLEYMGNKKNKVPMNSKTKKYYKAYKNNTLNDIFFLK